MNIYQDKQGNLNHLSYQPTSEDMQLYSFCYELANCIKQQRKKLSVTQESLAQISGVNRVTISRIENFQQIGTTEVIFKLLSALGLEIRIVEQQR